MQNSVTPLQIRHEGPLDEELQRNLYNFHQRPKSKKEKKKAPGVRKSDKWFPAEGDELDSNSSNAEIQAATNTQHTWKHQIIKMKL